MKIVNLIQKKSATAWQKFLSLLLIFFPIYFIYLFTLYPTVGTEDSGELIVSAATLDIAHPPGYPLHTLLGKLFTILIPFGNIGWRVNVLSAFFGAATITLLYLFIKKLIKNDFIATAASLFFGLSDIFWSQSIRTEVYTLNAFFLALIMVLLLQWQQTKGNKYLFWVALAYGLSLTNHQMMFLAGPPIVIFLLVSDWKKVLKLEIILISLFLFILGLSVYLYLPLRTLMGPYDNPAYIEHQTLATPQKFLDFVNRKIYGGTIHEDESLTQQLQTPLPHWLLDIGNIISGLFSSFVNNNGAGLVLFLKMISNELLFIPVLLFLPGVYFLVSQEKKLGVLILALFFFYSCVELVFTPVSQNMHPFSVFSVRPFLISATFVLIIICSSGLQLICQKIPWKKAKKPALTFLLFIPLIPLFLNFAKNNEKNNYIAYDFSKNLLESLPLNAYLLSTGRDNLTFPLYYLRKIEHLRPDIELEIYYGKNAVEKNYLEQKKEEKGKDVIFIDLLPNKYNDFHLLSYNFIYAYGDTTTLLPQQTNPFILRGLRPDLDYPNNKLEDLYYLKLALANPNDPATRDFYFKKVQSKNPANEQFTNFISDYYAGKDDTGMF